jgi:DNA polymerase alpha subunit B
VSPVLLNQVVQDAITIVGSITVHNDGLPNTTRLTNSSIALQASRSTGSGVVVPLSFDPFFKVRGNSRGLAPSSLFPGAVVALRGKNGGGGWFLVTEVLFVSSQLP